MTDMSGAASEFAMRAKNGRFDLQRCEECGAVSWPPRDACASCWSDQLIWTAVAQTGVVLAATTLHASQDEFFRARLPWRIGTIRLDAGPVAYAHLHQALGEGDAVRIGSHRDFKARGVLVARPLKGGDDPKISELISKREE